jgi:hypothetical protein
MEQIIQALILVFNIGYCGGDEATMQPSIPNPHPMDYINREYDV